MNFSAENHTSTIADANPVVIKNGISKLDQVMNFFKTSLKGKHVVSVLRLYGVIGRVGGFRHGLSIECVNELIEKAFSFDKLAAVCLCINSPGGSPVQSELIARRITDLATEKNVKVYSFVEDVAASGGYWLACAGNEIYASKSSIVGSIGVISSGFGFQDAINKIGIERRVYSQGKNKSVLDPFLSEKTEDVKIIKNIQKYIHNSFIDYVKESRAWKLTQNDDMLFNGEFWTGEVAKDFGLIDGINSLYPFIRDKFGESIKIEYINKKQSWFKKKLGMTEADLLNQKDLVNYALESIRDGIVFDKFNFF